VRSKSEKQQIKEENTSNVSMTNRGILVTAPKTLSVPTTPIAITK
jgi:hypothetical protein